jgi:hypothetical protein
MFTFKLQIALAALALVASTGCSSSLVPPDGTCVQDQTVSCSVSFSLDGGTQSVGLLGYSCTGTRRPDQDAKYVDEVPQGTVCASRGPNATGQQTYCCSPPDTSCAYNPAATDCDATTDGYQCRGSSRPEALNPAILCGNGVQEGDYVNYCCSGQKQPAECIQTNAVTCSERLTGFSCPAGALPKAEELGASESRADFYRPLCPIPTPAANVKYSNYCCFTPSLVPEGGSCVQDTLVAGCAAGRFGFACYGPDTPNQDYPPMHCPDKGVAGKSADGYPATLYCCDFQ